MACMANDVSVCRKARREVPSEMRAVPKGLTVIQPPASGVRATLLRCCAVESVSRNLTLIKSVAHCATLIYDLHQERGGRDDQKLQA